MKTKSYLISNETKRIVEADLLNGSTMATRAEDSRITLSELELLGAMFLQPIEGLELTPDVKAYLELLLEVSAETHIQWLVENHGYTFVPLPAEDDP